jgi:hypothetical protein
MQYGFIEIQPRVSAMTTFTSKNDEAFFAAIGRLTISWAYIEAGLDFSVDVIHRCLGGMAVEPEAPKTSLFRKLRYIRKWAKTAPEPTFRDSVAKLLEAIEKAGDLRHDIIHGFVVEQMDGSGEAEMIRLLHHTTSVSQKRYRVTTTQILKAAVEANKLGGRSLQMGTGLQDLVASLTKKTDDSADKL